MDVHTAWATLAQAIDQVHRPDGDYNLKLETVRAGVQLLFEFPAEDILRQVEQSSLSTRALVSWLVFEGERLNAVDPLAVSQLRSLYEASCAPGEGIIPPPSANRARVH